MFPPNRWGSQGPKWQSYDIQWWGPSKALFLNSHLKFSSPLPDSAMAPLVKGSPSLYEAASSVGEQL